MHEGGGNGTAEQPRELNLAAGRRQQIHAADDDIDVLTPVIDRDRELIGPVAEPIANQQVAALPGRRLRLSPEQRIVEHLDGVWQTDPPADTAGQRQAAIAAGTRIPQLSA